MKKLEYVSIVLLAFILCAGAISMIGPKWAGAGDITATGMNQPDVYNYLNNVKTMSNELKSDHNVVLGSYSAIRALAAESKTDHNVLLGSYSSLRADYVGLRAKYNTVFSKLSSLSYQAGKTGGFATFTGTQKITMGNQRVAGSADSTVVTNARTTTGTNTAVVSGARTSTTDLTFQGL